MTISHWIILRMRSVSDESFRQNQNTFYVQRFPESLAVFGIMSKCGAAGEATSDNTMWGTRVACRISKATLAHAHEHSHAPGHSYKCARACRKICNIAFPRQQWFCERAWMSLYTYIACLLFSVFEKHFKRLAIVTLSLTWLCDCCLIADTKRMTSQWLTVQVQFTVIVTIEFVVSFVRLVVWSGRVCTSGYWEYFISFRVGSFGPCFKGITEWKLYVFWTWTFMVC